LKLWIKKLIDQLEFGDQTRVHRAKLSEEGGTILFLLDVYCKHLFDLEGHPLHRARTEFESFARELIDSDRTDLERALFRFRQFFATYRSTEFNGIQKSFEDLKEIIWSFIEQLSDDFNEEQMGDKELNTKLEKLKQAVVSEPVESLRAKSAEFIQLYMTHHARKDHRRLKRMRSIRQSLNMMKTQTKVPDRNIKVDSLTQTFNRRSFDEHIKHQAALSQLESTPVTMVMIEIDHLRRLSDTYGHDFGEFLQKECARALQECFKGQHDFIAHIDGELFSVVLGVHALPLAVKRVEVLLNRVRGEIFVKDTMELRMTTSIGIAQHRGGETVNDWLRRSMEALQLSKDQGFDRITVSESQSDAA
jgi:diguanylate cyclase (GGDEF)-like protein